MTDKIFKIYLDFDGTITRDDVGEAIFRRFTNNELANKIVEDLLTDKISARECWEELCNASDFIDKNEFDEFILSQEVDPTLQSFIKYCDEKNLEVTVLSDGFDYYVDKILTRENLGHLKVYCNQLNLTSDGKLMPSFPFYNESCRGSANCKRNHIIENSSEEEYTVFIGDGISDNEAIQYVDFIFAKSDLLRYCETQRITYFPFKNFDDVISRLEDLSSKKRLKKRHQAQLKRREVYLAE